MLFPFPIFIKHHEISIYINYCTSFNLDIESILYLNDMSFVHLVVFFLFLFVN